MGKLTNEERLMRLEVRLDDVCVDLAEIKTSQQELLKEMRRHCEVAEVKYATKDELSFVRKWLYLLSGSLVTFLIWAFQEYLKIK
jgi:hypothetical protein